MTKFKRPGGLVPPTWGGGGWRLKPNFLTFYVLGFWRVGQAKADQKACKSILGHAAFDPQEMVQFGQVHLGRKDYIFFVARAGVP